MSGPMPSLESLRCFVEAARLLNFRAAASAVALTPAALGQRIKQLEDQLAVRLFHRTTRTVTLTEHGHALVPYARRSLETAAACMSVGRGALDAPPLELTLGTRHELGMSWLVPLLPRLRRGRPPLALDLYVGAGPDLVHRVRTARIDCAVTSAVLTDPKLDGIRLHEERYALVAAPRLLRARPLARPADAARHTLIDTDPATPLFRYLRDEPTAPRLEFASVASMGTIDVIRTLAIAGEGVAVLPAYFVARDLAARRLTRVLPRQPLLSDFFRLVHRADDPRRPIFHRLAAVLQAAPLR